MQRSTFIFRLGGGAPSLVTNVISDPTIPSAGATVDLGGQSYRASNFNTQGIYDLRAGGITLKNGTLDGRGLCPLWIMDSSTSACAISNVHGLSGSAIGSFETNVLGGDMQAQTGGGTTVRGCQFDYMKIRFGGIGHIFQANRFYQSPEGALQRGIRPNDLTKWSENSAFGSQILDNSFVECGTTWTASTDDGILYGGRRWGTPWYLRRNTFTSCKGNAFYWDDLATLLDCDTLFCYNQTGRAIHINGGPYNTVLNVYDYNSSLASKWTDIGSMQNGTGGSYGSNYGNGSWHGALPVHNNAATWSHGGISGDNINATSIYTALNAEHTKLLLAGSANWLSALNAYYAVWGTDYATLYALDTTFGTSGTLSYTRAGSTPAITGNANASTLPSGVTQIAATVTP